MKTAVRLLCLIIAALTVRIPSYAAEYTDTLRVGIYYGSDAAESVTAESAQGFTFGVYSGRVFKPLKTAENTRITAERDTADKAGGAADECAWHVRYGECASEDEMRELLTALSENGIEGFPAFSDGKLYVWGGSFKNSNDAVWAAENLAVRGIAIKTSEKAIRVTDAASRVLFVCDDAAAGCGIAAADYGNQNSQIDISGAAGGAYRGGFEFKRLDDGKLTVVNVVPTEKYLCGVVSREMSPSWNREALKAQAVCARNFALRRIDYHGKYGFDVCRTVCCQAYSGISGENENVRAAVEETSGELLFYGDELAQTVYSSSMGENTENAENVWGTPVPYLVSVDNPYEDTENIYNGKWTKTLTRARATELMKKRGCDVGEVTSVAVMEYTPAGRVLKLKVTGTNGEKVFEREACRSVFSEATYSQKYTVTSGGGAAYPSVYVTDGNGSTAKALNAVTAIGADNEKALLTDGCFAADGAESKRYTVQVQNGDADTFIFSGEGWGHGVGMSQYGAKGMADAGFSYRDILTHYYTGTSLKKVY